MSTSRTARLGWGQRYHWLRYQHMPAGSRHEAHIADSSPLPDGVSLAQVRSALTYLVRRHEGLRTCYDAQGWQRIQPPAPFPLPEVTTEQDGTPAPAEAIAALVRADFVLDRDWPVRGCVVTTGGVPKLLQLVFNHLAFDDVSLGVLREELQAVLTGLIEGRPRALPPVRTQPVDLAVAEAASQAEVAMAHWQREISRLPADVSATRRDPGTAHSASLTSPGLLDAAREIAGRARVWPAAVHLAAYAITAACHTGRPVIATRIYTSQREASGHGPLMTCMSFPALMTVAMDDDPPFSTVLERAARQIEGAMTHAHVPYDELLELLGEESARRGRPVRAGSELNFLTNAPRSCGTRRDRFTRHPAPADWAHSGSDTYLRVYEWSDGVTLMLQAAGDVMDAGAVELFLRGYHALLDAHRDPALDWTLSEAAARLGTAAPRVAPADLTATAAALREHPAVESARLAADDRGLVAFVRTTVPVTPAQLRAQLLDAMPEHPDTPCPDWFHVTTSEDGATLDGDGRDHPPRRAGTAAERDLAAAVAAANDLGDGATIDVAAGYFETGARALAMPAVLAELARRGWHGVGQDQLTGIRPLGALAARLERAGRP